MLLSEPEYLLAIVVYLPTLISIVLVALIGHHIWYHKIGRNSGLIAVGAILILLSFAAGGLMNFVFLPTGAIEHEKIIFFYQANGLLSGLGYMLFFWGIYQYFRTEQQSDTPTTSMKGPFIES